MIAFLFGALVGAVILLSFQAFYRARRDAFRDQVRPARFRSYETSDGRRVGINPPPTTMKPKFAPPGQGLIRLPPS